MYTYLIYFTYYSNPINNTAKMNTYNIISISIQLSNHPVDITISGVYFLPLNVFTDHISKKGQIRAP